MDQEQLEKMAGYKYILLKHLVEYSSPAVFQVMAPDDWIKDQYSIQVTEHSMTGGAPRLRRIVRDFPLHWLGNPDWFMPLQFTKHNPAFGQYL